MAEPNYQEVERFAALLLTDDELDQVLELPSGSVRKALDREGDLLGRSVRAGRLRTKCELHVSLITTARRHSTPAQQKVGELLQRLESQ